MDVHINMNMNMLMNKYNMDMSINKQSNMAPTMNEDISSCFQRMKADHIRANMNRQQRVDEFTIQMETRTTFLNQFLYNWNHDIFDVDTKCDLIQYFKSLDNNFVPTTDGNINYDISLLNYNRDMSYFNKHAPSMSDDDINIAFQQMETEYLQLKIQRQKNVDEFTIELNKSALQLNKFLYNWHNNIFDIDIKCDLIRIFGSEYTFARFACQEVKAKPID